MQRLGTASVGLFNNLGKIKTLALPGKSWIQKSGMLVLVFPQCGLSDLGAGDAFIHSSDARQGVWTDITLHAHFHNSSTALQPAATFSTITAFGTTDATRRAWSKHTL